MCVSGHPAVLPLSFRDLVSATTDVGGAPAFPFEFCVWRKWVFPKFEAEKRERAGARAAIEVSGEKVK